MTKGNIQKISDLCDKLSEAMLKKVHEDANCDEVSEAFTLLSMFERCEALLSAQDQYIVSDVLGKDCGV